MKTKKIKTEMETKETINKELMKLEPIFSKLGNVYLTRNKIQKQ